jgi:hypothetical protein
LRGLGAVKTVCKGLVMREGRFVARVIQTLLPTALGGCLLMAGLGGCGGGGGGGASAGEADVDGVRIVHASLDSSPYIIVGAEEQKQGGPERVGFAQFGHRFWPAGGEGSSTLQLQSMTSKQVVASVDISSSAIGERLSDQLGKRVGRYAVFVSGLSENGSLRAQLMEESTGVSDPSSTVFDVLNGVAGAGTLRVMATLKDALPPGGDAVGAAGATLDIAEGAQGIGLVVGARAESEGGNAGAPTESTRTVTFTAQPVPAGEQSSASGDTANLATARIYEESFTIEPGARYTLLITGQPGYLVVGRLVKK